MGLVGDVYLLLLGSGWFPGGVVNADAKLHCSYIMCAAQGFQTDSVCSLSFFCVIAKQV